MLIKFGLLYILSGLVPIKALTGKVTTQDVIDQLGLVPSVEKGYYIETFRDPATYGNRSVSTAIYYLLEGAVGKSYWHRVDASEVWHYYAGSPMTLFLSFDDGQPVRQKLLGPDIFGNQSPQVIIMAQEWQQALSHGEWTLVGTTVAPAFIQSGFELAPPEWQPDGA